MTISACTGLNKRHFWMCKRWKKNEILMIFIYASLMTSFFRHTVITVKYKWLKYDWLQDHWRRTCNLLLHIILVKNSKLLSSVITPQVAVKICLFVVFAHTNAIPLEKPTHIIVVSFINTGLKYTKHHFRKLIYWNTYAPWASKVHGGRTIPATLKTRTSSHLSEIHLRKSLH